MIVHIVFIKFKDSKVAGEIKEALESLPAKISEIKSFEVGIDFSNSERSCDLSLYSTFDSKEALQAYAVDPEHLKVVEKIKKVAEYTKVVDYEK